MKTERIRYTILRIVSAFLVLGCISSISCVVTSDDGYGSTSSKYNGPYNLSASHSVNLYYTNTSALETYRKSLYQEFLSWGMTPQASAAVLGNIVCESAGDPTRTENNVGWGSYKWGTTGLGLIQWTYWSLQANLFNTAASMGRQWTDFNVQIQAMKNYFGPGSGASYLYTEGAGSTYELAGKFMDDYEMPYIRNYDTRGNTAVEMYNKYSGLPAESAGETVENPESGEITEGETNATETEETLPSVPTLVTLVKEWDLVGMPESSGLSSDALSLQFPDAVYNYRDRNSIAQLGEDISMRKEMNIWSNARVTIVFVGILMIVYSIFMIGAVVLDNVNNFIDVSFVSLLSLGTLYYSKDVDNLSDPRRFVSTKRMFIIIVIFAFVGLFCVSGGIFSYILKALYWVFSKF